MDTQGEQLPKATVQQFIKQVTGSEMKCSNDFVTAVMCMAKEYISQVSDQANNICLEQGKKTISGEFFYQAILKFQLQAQMPELKEIEEEVREEVNVKNQNKAKFQDEGHLKLLEQQQKQLYENAKAENNLLFKKQEQDEEENKQRRPLIVEFGDEEQQ